MSAINQNCLSHWFPILASTGVLVPTTEIVRVPGQWRHLINVLDGKTPANFEPLIDLLKSAAAPLGYPVFLRTGQTSGKHKWTQTCYVATPDHLPSHVVALVEFSECCSITGLPYDVFAVREFLPLATTFTAFAGNMPINRERRYFIRDGKVQCRHGYWPAGAVAKGKPKDPDWQRKLTLLNYATADDEIALLDMSVKVARAMPGYWSLDWAQTTDGRWYAIDMALGDESFHDLGCEYCPETMRQLYAE